MAATPALAGYGTSHAIDLKGDHACIADGNTGVHVVDIGTPTNPVWVAGYNTPGTAFDIHVVGDHAYVSDYVSNQMLVIDIADPAAPMQATSSSTPR